MKIAIAVAVVAVAVAANIVFKWYSKKSKKDQPAESSSPESGSDAFSTGYLNTPQVSQLRKSAAAELGLSIEELDRMLAKEMKQMAMERELINEEIAFRSKADLSAPGN